MYMVTVYRSYTVTLDMDHVIQLRKLVNECDYGEVMDKLGKFQEDLLSYASEKTWVLNFFGELPVLVFLFRSIRSFTLKNCAMGISRMNGVMVLTVNKLFSGKDEVKDGLKEILLCEHQKLWDGVFRELKAWVDTKKPISTDLLPCSKISMLMGTK